MNADNQRLREIQFEKAVYKNLICKSDSIKDCLLYQERLDVLCDEEKTILNRFDVVV